jgi:hypothetical protein
VSDGLKGTYEVAVGDRAVYVRVHGLGSMNNCLCLRDFLDDMLREGRNFIVFDLADCTGMDSTFMGCIAGVATEEVKGRPVGVAVVNAADNLVKLLEGVGLDELVFIDPEPFASDNATYHRLEEQATESERLRLIKSAHENLINLSAENEQIFGDLVRTIEREMKHRGLLRG